MYVGKYLKSGILQAGWNKALAAATLHQLVACVLGKGQDCEADSSQIPRMSSKQVDTMRRAREIMSAGPLIDGHNDLPIIIRGYYHNKIHSDAFSSDKELVGHVDIKRLRQGSNGGVFWSAYVNCPAQDENNSFDDDGYLETIRETMQQIDLVKILIGKFPDHLQLAVSADQVLEAFTAGRIASMIGIEGLHQIGNSFSVLRCYYDLGVRYATLTHNHNNAFADSATSSKPAHDGLSDRGREVVREMNRLGMMVDLSHTSEKTCRDVLEMTTVPLIFSHSSAYGLTPHPRNVTDRVLGLLKENKGVIMISFVPEFSSTDPQSSSHEHVLDHIVYVGTLIGYDHVGIGSDFDGIPKAVTGLEDVSAMPRLVAGLIDRGVCESDLLKITGHNVLRVMRAVEEAAASLRDGCETAMPLDKVKPLWNDEFRRKIAAAYPSAYPIDFD